MTYVVKKKLIVLVAFSVFTPAEVQMPMPMPMPMYMPAPVPQPVYAVPQMAVAVAVQLPDRKTSPTTTTTTTPEPQYAVAVPVPLPLPMPMPFAVPAQPPPVICRVKPRPKSCPPCPPCICLPSCTPAFFAYCSPCHQRCRCQNPADAPVPLPPPVPVPAPMFPVPAMPALPAPVGPPPVMVVPLPPIVRRPYVTSSSESDTSDDCDSDSDRKRYYLRRAKKFKKSKKIHKRHYRRNAGDESDGNKDLVKPVLSYVSENGDVKFEAKLSNRDALKLLSGGKTSEKQVDTENDDDSVVLLKGDQRSGRRYNKVLLRNTPNNQELNRGKHQLVFKPSPNKKINSVAVSFDVT